MCVSLPRIYGADFKMEIYLKIAQLYLEKQDHVSAEAYINRATLLQYEVAKKEVCTICFYLRPIIHSHNIMLKI